MYSIPCFPFKATSACMAGQNLTHFTICSLLALRNTKQNKGKTNHVLLVFKIPSLHYVFSYFKIVINADENKSNTSLGVIKHTGNGKRKSVCDLVFAILGRC